MYTFIVINNSTIIKQGRYKLNYYVETLYAFHVENCTLLIKTDVCSRMKREMLDSIMSVF